MPSRLSGLEVSQIDFVPRGASQDAKSGEGAHILIAKRAPAAKSAYSSNEPEPATTFNEELLATKIREREWKIREDIMAKVWALCDAINKTVFDPSADREGMISSSLSQFTASMLESMPNWLNGEIAKAASSDAKEKLSQVLKFFNGLKAGKEAPMPEVTVQELQKKLDDQTAEITKANERATAAETSNAELKKSVEDLQKSNGEALALAKSEKDARLTNDAKQFIGKSLSHISVDPDKDAGIVKALQNAEPLSKEQSDRVLAILTGANETAKSGKAFVELGAGGAGAEGTVQAEVEAKAAKLMEGNSKLTKAAAVSKVYEQNPALYERAESERMEKNAARSGKRAQ